MMSGPVKVLDRIQPPTSGERRGKRGSAPRRHPIGHIGQDRRCQDAGSGRRFQSKITRARHGAKDDIIPRCPYQSCRNPDTKRPQAASSYFRLPVTMSAFAHGKHTGHRGLWVFKRQRSRPALVQRDHHVCHCPGPSMFSERQPFAHPSNAREMVAS